MGPSSLFGRLTAAARRIARRRLLGRLDLDALVARGLRIGVDCFVDPDTTVDVDFCWLISIGDRCTIAPRVVIIAHDASTKRALGFTRVGRVHIGDDTFVGAGSIVLPGVTIGAGSIVGAGSVVREDVPPGAVVTGNPAEVRGDSAGHLARQRARLQDTPTFDRPGLHAWSGPTAPLALEILRATERHRTVFVE